LKFGEMEFGEMKRNTSNWSNFCMLLRRAGLTASAGLSCSRLPEKRSPSDVSIRQSLQDDYLAKYLANQDASTGITYENVFFYAFVVRWILSWKHIANARVLYAHKTMLIAIT